MKHHQAESERTVKNDDFCTTYAVLIFCIYNKLYKCDRLNDFFFSLNCATWKSDILCPRIDDGTYTVYISHTYRYAIPDKPSYRHRHFKTGVMREVYRTSHKLSMTIIICLMRKALQWWNRTAAGAKRTFSSCSRGYSFIPFSASIRNECYNYSLKIIVVLSTFFLEYT